MRLSRSQTTSRINRSIKYQKSPAFWYNMLRCSNLILLDTQSLASAESTTLSFVRCSNAVYSLCYNRLSTARIDGRHQILVVLKEPAQLVVSAIGIPLHFRLIIYASFHVGEVCAWTLICRTMSGHPILQHLFSILSVHKCEIRNFRAGYILENTPMEEEMDAGNPSVMSRTAFTAQEGIGV